MAYANHVKINLMQTAKIRECTNCTTLLELITKVDCSIYNLARNQWMNKSYATELYFDPQLFKTLARLKRILYKRSFNPHYAHSRCYDANDIITLATRLLYKTESCPECPCGDFDTFITTSTTNTSSSTTTFFSSSTTTFP